MVRAGIIGATGYTGAELVRILSGHPDVTITAVVNYSLVGKKFSDIYPTMRNIFDMECEELNVDHVSGKCDVVFTALSHGVAQDVIPRFLERGVKVIDLSADFRYKSSEVYEKWYHTRHQYPELLAKSVYGLPELHREEIKNTSLVGNPGCYTTCSILGTAPLLANKVIQTKNIIIDAKSGVSGAGRKAETPYLFTECTENFKAYGVTTHRHTSEIEQELGLVAGEEILVSFTPHLVPMKRGILATIYANLTASLDTEEIINMYKAFYKDEYFVRVYEKGSLPETKNVAGSNFIDIGLVVDKRLNRVIVVSAIDNLVKGASGQAVQNLNVLYGFDEKTSLTAPGLYL